MNNKITYIIDSLAIIAFLGVVWLTFGPAKAPVTATFGNTSTSGTQSNLPNPTNYDYLVARLSLGYGTNSTNIIQSGQRVVMGTATLIPCSFQNPSTVATSSYEFSANVTTATSSAVQLVLATATTATATTTAQGVFSEPATQFTIATQGTTTLGSGTVGPSQYLNLGTTVSSAVGYGYTFGGSCNVIWTTTN